MSTQLDDKISECVSVGFLIIDGDRKKTIVASVDVGFGLDDPNVCGAMHIPSVAVISLRVIEAASPTP